MASSRNFFCFRLILPLESFFIITACKIFKISEYMFLTIIACVLIYFLNDFSAALGKAEKLTVEVAVWMPIVIIFIFSTVGVIYANQK